MLFIGTVIYEDTAATTQQRVSHIFWHFRRWGLYKCHTVRSNKVVFMPPTTWVWLQSSYPLLVWKHLHVHVFHLTACLLAPSIQTAWLSVGRTCRLRLSVQQALMSWRGWGSGGALFLYEHSPVISGGDRLVEQSAAFCVSVCKLLVNSWVAWRMESAEAQHKQPPKSGGTCAARSISAWHYTVR